MSDSDTFLDEILEGVITEPQAGIRPGPPGGILPDEPTPVEPPSHVIDEPRPNPDSNPTGLDELLDGLRSPTEPKVTDSGRRSGDAPAVSEEAQARTAADLSYTTAVSDGGSPKPESDNRKVGITDSTVTEPVHVTAPPPATESTTRPVDLPVASPHEILGIPGQSDSSASHFDLAQEVNDVSATEPVTNTRDSHSFAAIAQEIADTVDVGEARSKSAAQSSEDQQEADRSNLYLRSSGRRRRRRVNRMAFAQVIGIVLLLVVGLAGEWEYVSRGQASTSSNSPAATAPLVAAVRLPRVTSTKVAGALFQFQASGSAQSTPFRMNKPFSVAWTARCSQLSKTSAVQVLFQSAGRTALNIAVGVVSHTTRGGTSATLRPGVYTVVAHSPGTCIWRAEGLSRP